MVHIAYRASVEFRSPGMDLGNASSVIQIWKFREELLCTLMAAQLSPVWRVCVSLRVTLTRGASRCIGG